MILGRQDTGGPELGDVGAELVERGHLDRQQLTVLDVLHTINPHAIQTRRHGFWFRSHPCLCLNSQSETLLTCAVKAINERISCGGPEIVNDVAMGTLIYDADCGFCTRSAMWLHEGSSFELQAGQSIADLHSLGLSETMLDEAAYWSEGGKVVAGGADAIGRALMAKGRWYATLLGRVTTAAPVRPFAKAVYRVVAKNRHSMPGGTAACRINTP